MAARFAAVVKQSGSDPYKYFIIYTHEADDIEYINKSTGGKNEI